MLRSSKSTNSTSSKRALEISLEKHLCSAKRAAAETGRGELGYHENIPSKTYKLVFSQLTLNEMKIARLVCKKWHREIFSSMEERSCFLYKGSDNPLDLGKARELSSFLNVVPKDSFQWRMLKALYSKPEEAVPAPVLIQWSHLRLKSANFTELKQWVFKIHMPNVSTLELYNVRMNWSQYLLIFRELVNLSDIRDTCINLQTGIWHEFEKGCGCQRRLTSTPLFHGIHQTNHQIRELISHADKIKHIKIRRSRLEEVILFLKMFLAMELSQLEKIELSCENCWKSWTLNRDFRRTRQDSKAVLFAYIAAILKNNETTLKQLTISFLQSTIPSQVDQYTKEIYEDDLAFMYKPDFRDFLVFIKQQRWHENLNLRVLEELKLEFENRKIPTIEEIDYFSTFLVSLNSLRSLSISDLLVTRYNSSSIPVLIKKMEASVASQSPCRMNLGLLLKAHDNNDTPPKDRDQLVGNMELFYSYVRSLIVSCSSNETDVKSALFPWKKKKNNENQSDPDSSTSSSHSSFSASSTISRYSYPSLEHFWFIDEREVPSNKPPFFTKDVVQTYPNLVTLIIRDNGNSLICSLSDLSRWTILDDDGLQLVLGGLQRLKHFEVKGNLFFITDWGVTGINEFSHLEEEEIDLSENQNGSLSSDEIDNSYSFSNLKDLEYCELDGVGPKFTSLSLEHGFNDLPNLRFLRISGLIHVDDTDDEMRKFRENFTSNCEIEITRIKMSS